MKRFAGMYKLLLACLYCTAVLHVAVAQHTGVPVIPDKNFMITDFGATGDGKTLNTTAIQRALDEAGKQGGKVIVPEGVFLCGPLKIYSKTNLELQKGAVLRLRNDVDAYPAEKEKYLNFISISGATDVKISGEGIVDGQGEIWWKKFTAKEITYRRPQLFFIERTQRVEITGITSLNSPNTHFSLKDVRDVYIHHIRIVAPAQSRNTDGINIAARNCTIEHCDIRTGDDNIALNFGNKNAAANDPECSNILIRDCFFGVGHGLSIGSFTAGGLNNLVVSNCVFDSTTSALRIKSARGRGGIVQHVSYTDITIKNVKWPVFFSAYYPKEPANPADDTVTVATANIPVYRDIQLKNINITNAETGLKIWGLPEAPIQDITFDNVLIAAKNSGELYNVRGVKFNRSKINAQKGKGIEKFQAQAEGL